MHITPLEFLGVCFNILMFEHMITPGSAGAITGLLRTDALTAALTLPRESQRRPALIHAYQWMRVRPEWQRFSPMLAVQHLYGDANVMADPVSRARWEEVYRRCAQMGVFPQRIAVCPAAREFYSACADFTTKRPHAGKAGFSFANFTCGAFKITRAAAAAPRARRVRRAHAERGRGRRWAGRRLSKPKNEASRRRGIPSTCCWEPCAPWSPTIRRRRLWRWRCARASWDWPCPHRRPRQKG